MTCIRWHGGKHYLAKKIVELMPPHSHYVEPFAGGLSVLLAKSAEGISEVVNDINYDLMNFWKVLQDPVLFEQLQRVLSVTPFSDELGVIRGDMVQRAQQFFILCRQSLGGRMDTPQPISVNRTRRGMNEQVSSWLGAIDGLKDVHERLIRVAIQNKPALTIIKQNDSPHTLFYCDPPYLQDTRTAKEVYPDEMTDSDHLRLLEALNEVEGKVLLSGYKSDLYRAKLDKWKLYKFDLPNNSASGETKERREECLWYKFWN